MIFDNIEEKKLIKNIIKIAIGFNTEELEYENLKFKVWDLGGQEALRPYWSCYFNGTNALIFVIDSCDRQRIGMAKVELFKLCEEKDLQKSVIAIFANKQDDVEHAMSVEEISKEMGLSELKHNTWAIFKTSGLTGDGLKEGMSWIASKCK